MRATNSNEAPRNIIMTTVNVRPWWCFEHVLAGMSKYWRQNWRKNGHGNQLAKAFFTILQYGVPHCH
jgi:hypothetical protein